MQFCGLVLLIKIIQYIEAICDHYNRMLCRSGASTMRLGKVRVCLSLRLQRNLSSSLAALIIKFYIYLSWIYGKEWDMGTTI